VQAIELWETGILRIHIHAAKGLRSPTNAKLIQSHVIAYEGLETSDRKVRARMSIPRLIS
jgi:hypothetical protein